MNNPPHGPPGYDRDRERERDEDQRRAHAVQQQQQELLQREQNERQERERERQHREHYQPAPPHQNDTASIPLHQPVASRLPGAIHSPGGLLANHGGAPPPPAAPLGAPSGPGNAFGGPLHSEANRSIQHNPPATNQLQQQQAFGPSIFNQPPANVIGTSAASGVAFGGPLQQQPTPQQQQQQLQLQQQDAVARMAQQLPFGGPIPQGHQPPGAPALGQAGQQPILNDALSYLDQVKIQFADQPDVYNRFLDIMKDFKSQAIDTPGVISRVSDLFAGHPALIQGFNTFLPPGYRIECGPGDSSIRVTTPMGTTVQTMINSGARLVPNTGMSLDGPGSGSGGLYGSQPRQGHWQQQPDNSEGPFSPQNQNAGPAYGQNRNQQSSYEAQQAAAATHQQQQMGASQVLAAANVSSLGPPRNTQTPTPGGQSGMNGAGQQGLEKRGPVEFNHAISYVNKIKNRFQDRPEIYKQFLEILQTYQRESKPIQDVYAQVTTLFNTAPDLLEDFKQFLPESAAHAKAAAQKAAEDAAMAASQTPQNNSFPRDGPNKLPPAGIFAVPASSSKENKKRARGGNAGGVAPTNVSGPSGAGNKRPKLNHNKSMVTDAQAVSPTLTPVLPEPLPPNVTSAATSEELAFFDRVKKHIGDKKRMNEFLKLCNLFSQDMIDRGVLMFKASTFIGMSSDLMTWFQDFVGTDGLPQEQMQPIDNRPKPPTGRVSLSNCRALGPSYRLLPKRESLKTCSGRDEMCNEVLNDDWASHPTWASEDSGFVAHRKNVYEEGLHRIEEERHDYDFNIEANAKVIQLLEPIGQNLLVMSTEERKEFRMPIGLGGQSQAIYKRVLKKIYGDRGPEVVADLFKDPAAVLPIVLARLKQKDEEWRFTQREWEKVWNAQTNSMYLRSLDHMGLSVKQADKRNFSQKHLIDAIKTKHEEQVRIRRDRGINVPKYQFAFDFSDTEVITHVLRLMIVYASNAPQHNGQERRRITDFFEKFLTVFFDLPEETVVALTANIDRGTPEEDFDDATPLELPNGGRGRRPVNGRKTDLRRGVLDKGRNGTRGRGQKEDSAGGSKESTPDVESLDEDGGETAEDRAVTEVNTEQWTMAPGATAVHGSGDELSIEDLKLKADEPFKHDVFSLYGNQTIYVFFTIFQTLYRRLKEVKESEAEAKEEEKRATEQKPAEKIGLMGSHKTEYHQPSDGQTYYARTLLLIEDFINGELDESKYNDFLRHYYLKKGWQLYTITDLLKSLARLGSVCASVDAKEKTPDLIDQFYRNREMSDTTYNTEINMRKQADKYIKDGELFLIQWAPVKNQATLRWIQREETTFDMNDMQRLARWQYYISSYIRMEQTEGVKRADVKKSLLSRNLPASDEEPKAIVFNEDLVLQVCVNTYKIIYKKGGTEYFIFTDKPFSTDPETNESFAQERLQKSQDARKQRFKEKFEMNNSWMKDLNHDEVSKITMDFKKWTDEGVIPGTEGTSADVEMA